MSPEGHGDVWLPFRQPHRPLCPQSCVGDKLTAVGDEVRVGPEAVLQTVSLFDFRGLLLLLVLILWLFLFFFILIITPHILDVLDKGKVGCE